MVNQVYLAQHWLFSKLNETYPTWQAFFLEYRTFLSDSSFLLTLKVNSNVTILSIYQNFGPFMLQFLDFLSLRSASAGFLGFVALSLLLLLLLSPFSQIKNKTHPKSYPNHFFHLNIALQVFLIIMQVWASLCKSVQVCASLLFFSTK